MAKKQKAGAAEGWRPWQLSHWFIVPLIVIAVAVFAVLEALVQIGDVPIEASTMRTAWLDWYCRGDSSRHCIDIPDTLRFEDSASSKSGTLTFLRPDTISSAATFAWLYFPTILAVLYAILWQIVDDEVKRTEPLHQAQSPGGATAASTLFASYISVPPILVPLQAIRWRQMAVFLSSMTYVLVGFVTPILQSQMFQIQNQVIQVGYAITYTTGINPIRRGHESFPDGDIIGRFTDNPEGQPLTLDDDLPDLTDVAKLQNVVYLDPTYARAQEAILLLAAVTGALLLLTTRSRRLTTKNSLKGLGSLASLAASCPDFLADMAPLAEASDHSHAAAAEKQLGSRIVHLGSKNVAGSEYGFWFEPPVDQQHNSKNGEKATRSGPTRKCIGPYFTLRVSGSLSWIAYIYFMAIILTFGGISKEEASPTESYRRTTSQGSSQIGISAINLVVVSVVKSLWVVVEEHVLSLSPFRSLARKPQPASPVFLRDYASMPIFLRTYRALRDGELALAAVTLVSILLEAGLTCFGITASMAQGQGFNLDAMYAIHWVAFAICAVMFFLSANLMGRLLKTFVVVGRNPDTLAARLSYFCKSRRLLADFAPMLAMDDAGKEAYLRSIPHRYALGSFACQTPDGQGARIQVVERVGEA